jgi:hypothetical protein
VGKKHHQRKYINRRKINVGIFIVNSPDRCLLYRLRGKDNRNYDPVAQDLYDGQGAET